MILSEAIERGGPPLLISKAEQKKHEMEDCMLDQPWRVVRWSLREKSPTLGPTIAGLFVGIVVSVLRSGVGAPHKSQEGRSTHRAGKGSQEETLGLTNLVSYVMCAFACRLLPQANRTTMK